jgi:hypothetical protein
LLSPNVAFNAVLRRAHTEIVMAGPNDVLLPPQKPETPNQRQRPYQQVIDELRDTLISEQRYRSGVETQLGEAKTINETLRRQNEAELATLKARIKDLSDDPVRKREQLRIDVERNSEWIKPAIGGAVAGTFAGAATVAAAARSQRKDVKEFTRVSGRIAGLNKRTAGQQIHGTPTGDRLAGDVGSAYDRGRAKAGLPSVGGTPKWRVMRKAARTGDPKLFKSLKGSKAAMIAGGVLVAEGVGSQVYAAYSGLDDDTKKSVRFVGQASIAAGVTYAAANKIIGSNVNIEPSARAVGNVKAGRQRLLREAVVNKDVFGGKHPAPGYAEAARLMPTSQATEALRPSSTMTNRPLSKGKTRRLAMLKPKSLPPPMPQGLAQRVGRNLDKAGGSARRGLNFTAKRVKGGLSTSGRAVGNGVNFAAARAKATTLESARIVNEATRAPRAQAMSFAQRTAANPKVRMAGKAGLLLGLFALGARAGVVAAAKNPKAVSWVVNQVRNGKVVKFLQHGKGFGKLR